MKYIYGLLILIPITLILHYGGIGGHSLVFFIAAGSLIPLAALLGRATEEVAVYTGPQVGALLNATLGNAAELIITIVALREGLVDVVKASIAGSIIGNTLLVLGFSVLLGGLKNGAQLFDVRVAGTNATIMALVVAALLIPAVFSLGGGEHKLSMHDIERLSDGLAVILIVLYGLYLLFTLRQPRAESENEPHAAAAMKLPVALGILAVSTGAIVWMSEILVGALEPTAHSLGLTELFIGVIVVPLVGNIAEHIVAVQVAIRNHMELSLGIAIGSGIQIALFVTPILVFAGLLLDQTMTLVFNPYELIALAAATMIAVLISVDGESNWLEGAELVGLYLMLGVAFYFVP